MLLTPIVLRSETLVCGNSGRFATNGGELGLFCVEYHTRGFACAITSSMSGTAWNATSSRMPM